VVRLFERQHFRIDPEQRQVDGATSVQLQGPDGRGVAGWKLILDADENIYGTTEFGGTPDSGTVFQVTP
jgi:uncharacterized repeat protein (TIGR03803 family)